VHAHSCFGEGRILNQLRGVLDGRSLQEFAARALSEKRLDFAAQFGICPGKQCRAFLGAFLASRMV